MKFLNFPNDGSPVVVNVAHVMFVRPRAEGGTYLYMAEYDGRQKMLIVAESFKHVFDSIAEATT